MTIDGYAHCGISKYRPVDDVLAVMNAAGVERAVLCQHLGEYDNLYLSQVVALRLADPPLLKRVALSGFHNQR